MGRTVDISFVSATGETFSYTISSEHNFLVGYVHSYIIDIDDNGTFEDGDWAQHFAFVYSGNTSIECTIKNNTTGEMGTFETNANGSSVGVDDWRHYYNFAHQTTTTVAPWTVSGFDIVNTGGDYSDSGTNYQNQALADTINSLPMITDTDSATLIPLPSYQIPYTGGAGATGITVGAQVSTNGETIDISDEAHYECSSFLSLDENRQIILANELTKWGCVTITWDELPDQSVSVILYNPSNYDPENPDGSDPDGTESDEPDIEEPTVTSIDLEVNPSTVAPGGHSTIKVTVNGTGEYSHLFSAEMSGNASYKTFLIDGMSSCNVWVGSDETAEQLTVTVTSMQDTSVSATATITIDHSAEEDVTTAEQLQTAFWQGYAAARALFGLENG